MILAAGRGERMRPLTDHAPKPLLKAGGHALIEYHLASLGAAGVREVVINLSWQGAQLRAALGDGSRHGLAIEYSDEGPVAMETGGGILQALPLLGEAPFLLVNGDVWTDFPLASLALPPNSLAQLLLVPNPPHHPDGDYALDPAGRVTSTGERCTYAGIAVLDPALLADTPPARCPLKPFLDAALKLGRLTGQHHAGAWSDVGTPGRLAKLDARLREGRWRHPVLAPAVG